MRAVAALDLLADDVARFQHLVADLLEISRFDSGAQELEPAARCWSGSSSSAALPDIAGRPVPVVRPPTTSTTWWWRRTSGAWCR